MRRPSQDLARELSKVWDAMYWVKESLEHQAAADAAMHMNTTIRPNPATTNFAQAFDDVERIIKELQEDTA